MFNQNLLTITQPIRTINATAAGTTAINGSSVDLADFAGCVFMCFLGTLTSTTVPSMKIQESDDNSTWADLASSSVAATDADGNKILVSEVRGPLKRYARQVITRATANTVVDAGLAIPYGPVFAPTSINSTQVGTTKKILNQPSAGTA